LPQTTRIYLRHANQARQLMLPGEMGERFKAMAWLRGLDMPCRALRCWTCGIRFEGIQCKPKIAVLDDYKALALKMRNCV